MIRYPVEKYDNLIDNSKAFYPITKRGFWHNGVHFTSNSAPVCNIHTGTVVAMRLTKDYEKIDVGKIPERYADIFAGYNDYFTKEGDFYSIKDDLTEEGKLNALIMIGSAFSNNFILVKHSVETQSKKPIEFYSLAMHLRPLDKLSFAEKVTTCWYYVTVSIDGSTYNSVEANRVNIRTEFNEDNVNTYTIGSGIHKIPCETIIEVLKDIEHNDKTYSIIEWTLDGSKYTGAIDKSLYRHLTDHYEIKRPGYDSNKHLIKGDHIYDDATEGLLVYSTKSKDTRTVAYLLKPDVPLLIDSKFYVDYDKDIGILVKFSKNGTLCHGYIYLEISDINTLTKNIEGATELSVTSVTSGNYTFELELKKSIDIDEISIPNVEVATGDIIGYLGSGSNTSANILPLHYEIFCSDNGFMTFDEDKEFYRSYFYTIPEGSKISGYEEKPTTTVRKKVLFDGGNLNDVYLRLTGQNKTLVQGEVFYEISVMAKIESVDDYYVKIIDTTNQLSSYTQKLEKELRYNTANSLSPDYYIYKPKGEKYFCDEKGVLKSNEEGKNEKIPQDFFYLLKETEPVYKILYIYEPLEQEEYTTFWIDEKHLEELEKYQHTETVPKPGTDYSIILRSTKAQKFSASDYLLTRDLDAEKILKEPERIELGTLKTLENGILEDENAYIEQYLATGDVDVTWKKVRNGDTSYWVDSNSLHGKTVVNYNKWNNFFYKVTPENAVTGHKPENYKNLLFSSNKPFDATTNFEEFIESSLHKEELRQLVHERSTEWKESEEYIDAFCKGLGSNKRKFIETKLEKLSFWDDVSSKAPQPVEQSFWDRLLRKPKPEPQSTSPDFPAKEINWYFHPINFINHLNKVVPINPYIGAEKIAYPAEKGRPTLFEVKNSPGFAPVYTSGDEYTLDGKTSYAHIVGRFNENYINVGTYKERFTEYYHEGVDLRGQTGTDIHSLIYAKVIAYGWYRGYGKTIILRNLSGIGVYLLGHLSEYMENIDEIMEKPAGKTAEGEVIPAQEGLEVIPGQVVGKTGGSGYYLNSLDAHLHITYYHYSEDTTNIFKTEEFIGSSIKLITRNEDKYKELVKAIRDPFNHTTKKVSNV